MSDARTVVRLPVRRQARILANAGKLMIDCMVQDLSAAGARLSVETSLGVPPEFDLVYNAGACRRPCRLVWSSLDQIGAVFLDGKGGSPHFGVDGAITG